MTVPSLHNVSQTIHFLYIKSTLHSGGKKKQRKSSQGKTWYISCSIIYTNIRYQTVFLFFLFFSFWTNKIVHNFQTNSKIHQRKQSAKPNNNKCMAKNLIRFKLFFINAVYVCGFFLLLVKDINVKKNWSREKQKKTKTKKQFMIYFPIV